jgi:acetyl-CoA carboxylase biotin carboxyl carrier protein
VTAPPPAEKAASEEPEGHVVRAPMVGLFYEAPAPGKPAFVTLGKTVGKGDVLCIIEAMKIMNQIEADVGGVIAKIMVENGEPVEYGQPLFVIREP